MLGENLWEPVGRPIPPEPWGDLQPVETLIYWDGALSFTFLDTAGRVFYAHYLDGDWGEFAADLYLAVPIDPEKLSRLRDGNLPFLAAMDCGETYVLQTGGGLGAEKAWAVEFADVPKDMLPRADVSLRPADASDR
jgi:hypothetical protein